MGHLPRRVTDWMGAATDAPGPPVGEGSVMSRTLSPEELATELRQVAGRRYHNHHPFHQLLHSGRLSKGQVRAWALNRTYYQTMIPVKDAIILSRLPDVADRRRWIERIAEHDGCRDGDGATERWLKLTDGLGLPRDLVLGCDAILPATRFAVDAYVNFVEKHSALEGVAASLTEIFAPTITEERVTGMLAGYDFISHETLAYFERRLMEPTRRADFSLHYVVEHARDAVTQGQAIAALTFKCDVLWAMLDGLSHAYVTPGTPPPGAYAIEEE
jgi:pyrroloquinoline quinone biosynthesis protein D